MRREHEVGPATGRVAVDERDCQPGRCEYPLLKRAPGGGSADPEVAPLAARRRSGSTGSWC